MTFSEEIEEAIQAVSNLGSITLLSSSDSQVVLNEVKRAFTKGTSTVLWHSFSKSALVIEYGSDEEIQPEVNRLFGAAEIVYLVIEEDDYYAVELVSNLVFLFLSECRYVVYYVVDKFYNKLLCENDHNQLLFLEKNDL